ncbi:hypothetical protein HAX54_046472 [Datura stramonium]|uniref:Uncharacterized protein n=1 Tax=Datura stramonium TaxID=4076 RepID=A0ABS8WJ37_DATST|nr:hypothetical protein [Datura stramonium]
MCTIGQSQLRHRLPEALGAQAVKQQNAGSIRRTADVTPVEAPTWIPCCIGGLRIGIRDFLPCCRYTISLLSLLLRIDESVIVPGFLLQFAGASPMLLGKAPASSTNKGKGKAKASTPHTNSKKVIIFCVPNKKKHYVICQGRSITAEKRFDLAGLHGDLPNITAQFTDRQ